MVPAWIWTGAVRLHAANGLFIEGKGWSKSVTFLLRIFRGLLFIQARSQDIRQMYLRRMCRSMKRPACALSIPPEIPNRPADFTAMKPQAV